MDPRRPPVWIALADLFLDTDVRPFYPEIARALAESPYTAAELTEIFHHEVKPVFVWNAFAGEWAGWDPAHVVAACAARQGRRCFWARWLTAFDGAFQDVLVLSKKQ